MILFLPAIPYLLTAAKYAVVALGVISMASLGLDAVGVDIGVFEALRGWTCWFFSYFADVFQDFVIAALDAAPGRGLVPISMLVVVYSWFLSVDYFLPVSEALFAFGAWSTVVLGLTAVKVLRLWIIKL